MYYNFQQVTDHIYHITNKDGAFCQLVIGREKALLFDTSYGYGNLREAVENYTKLPVLVVNSHGHRDHINGNNQFEGPCYLNKRDLELAGVHSSAERRAISVEDAKHYVTDRMKGTVENILPEDFDEEAYIHAKMPEWAFIKEGDVFDLGGVKLKVIEIPGHTQGCICLWEEESKVLLVGDSFGPFTWLFDQTSGNLSEYLSGLKKAQALAPKIMLAGHEPLPMTDPVKTLEAYIDAAEHPDYEHGIPFNPPMVEAAGRTDIRVIPRPGYEAFRFDLPGYASIVISPDHIK